MLAEIKGTCQLLALNYLNAVEAKAKHGPQLLFKAPYPCDMVNGDQKTGKYFAESVIFSTSSHFAVTESTDCTPAGERSNTE